MNFKTLNTMQKIALIWALPSIVILAFVAFVVSIVVMITVAILNYSGTIGASLFLLKEIKKKVVKFQFLKIAKQDQQQAAFDRMMHKEQ